ncbi:MAG: patatin-like phospholipase family protein [Iphinoe sp. HA4291-MV1]|jgi:patatin-like phospholipase/acyl hydrolase|nr:patatin-like phospholipase family protein [Iphinoe sp. HA4291-MV1]
MEQTDTFQILSLSGGGYLGLYQVTILCELEEKVGKPIAQCFDLLAGTSIGGIVALSLALEVPATTILHAFEKHGKTIFSDRPAPQSTLGKLADLARSLISSKYKHTGLCNALNEFIDGATLIGDLKHPVIIPTINLTKGRPQVFKTPHHERFERDYRVSVHEVALATSAAPTFFPLAQVGDELFTDGGLFANTPDFVALHEAEYFFQIPTEQIFILSVGTTTSQFSFSHSIGRDLGILKWFYDTRLMSVILSSQQKMTEFMLKHKLDDRYVRIDSIQSKAQERDLGLDVATQAAQSTIKGLAKASLREVISNPTLQRMLQHTPKKPYFYYGRFSSEVKNS